MLEITKKDLFSFLILTIRPEMGVEGLTIRAKPLCRVVATMWLGWDGVLVPAADVVRARIDPALKKAAVAVLSEMGLSLSDAIRLLLVRIAAERALPFDVRVPNAETQAAMREARKGRTTRFNNVGDLMADLNANGEQKSTMPKVASAKSRRHSLDLSDAARGKTGGSKRRSGVG